MQSLQDSGALQEGDSVVQATRTGPAPEPADPSAWQDLNPALAQALAELGVDNLFQYQAQVIDATANGANAALALPYGSDPSLNIGLTLAERLLRNPGSHGLVICPDGDRAAHLSSRLDGFLSALGLALLTVTGRDSQAAPVADDDHRQRVAVVTVDALNRSCWPTGKSGQTFWEGPTW